MRISVLRPIMALVLAMTFILVAAMPSVEALPSFGGGMKKIPAGQYFVVKGFTAQADASISYDVQVMFELSRTIDVLLMDKQNFELYKARSTFVYHSVSSLNVTYAIEDTGVGGLITGVEYVLVVDNTDRPPGGGPGNSEVSVMYFFSGSNIQVATDWGLVLILLAVVAVVISVIVLLVIFLLRKSNGRGLHSQPYDQQNVQPGMKSCPRCGEQVPAEFAYCPRCGNRY